MSDMERAAKFADRLLDEPLADPDDDLRNLARQFMRCREVLEWYAAATYPDDGSGRPADAYGRRARERLGPVLHTLAISSTPTPWRGRQGYRE